MLGRGWGFISPKNVTPKVFIAVYFWSRKGHALPLPQGKWPKNDNIPKLALNPDKSGKCLKQKAIPSVLGDVGLTKVVSEFSFRHPNLSYQVWPHERSSLKKKVTKRPFSSSCRNWPIWMKRSTLEFVTWNNSPDQCVLFKMGEWVGLCICATIKGRVSGWGRNLSGNCGINGSQTQLPARSIMRALPHDSSQLTNRRRQWARNNILTAVGTTTILADMFICRAVSIWSIFHDRH